MNQKDLVYNLKLLVSEDIELALETINDFVTENKTLTNEWINLRGRYNEVKSLIYSNTIPIETIKIELNNIRTAIINLIDRLDNSINLSKAWKGRVLNGGSMKNMYDIFQNIVEDDFNFFCMRHQLQNTSRGLTTFLIDSEIIKKETIISHTIKHEYCSMLRINKKEIKEKDFEVIKLIADKFKISNEDVISILGN